MIARRKPMRKNLILVVEDEPSIAEVVSLYLRKAGYETIAARDGRTALEVLDRETPELIILDIMLPGLDGFELCHRLRDWARAYAVPTDIPVLVLSAKAQDADKSAAFKVGANYYIVKPADPAKIVDAVKNMLNQPTSVASE